MNSYSRYARDSNEELLPETLKYIRDVNVDYRKLWGQFFTPKSIREELLESIPKIKRPKVIDPSCGTGEFLLSAQEYFGDADLYGWDIEKRLIDIARKVVPEAHIECTDALKKEYCGEFDFVIGNPPYYEFKPDREIKMRFSEIIWGRLNIYSLFIWLGIKLLKEGGYLAYVVSPSMNNGAYFAYLRRFIVRNANIENIWLLDSSKIFKGALQSVMIIVLKKGPNKGDYIFENNGILLFTERANYLKNKFEGKTTPYELGYEAETGKVIWNLNKELLTHSSEDAIPLIWAHNITKDGLKLGNHKNHKKPQYIKTNKYEVGPAIVVNRIVGRPGTGTIRAAIIPPDMKFVGENHVNVIFPPEEANMSEIEYIINQLNSPEKQEIVRSITGNTQISKNELEKLFPIDIKNYQSINQLICQKCFSKNVKFIDFNRLSGKAFYKCEDCLSIFEYEDTD